MGRTRDWIQKREGGRIIDGPATLLLPWYTFPLGGMGDAWGEGIAGQGQVRQQGVKLAGSLDGRGPERAPSVILGRLVPSSGGLAAACVHTKWWQEDGKCRN